MPGSTASRENDWSTLLILFPSRTSHSQITRTRYPEPRSSDILDSPRCRLRSSFFPSILYLSLVKRLARNCHENAKNIHVRKWPILLSCLPNRAFLEGQIHACETLGPCDAPLHAPGLLGVYPATESETSSASATAVRVLLVVEGSEGARASISTDQASDTCGSFMMESTASLGTLFSACTTVEILARSREPPRTAADTMRHLVPLGESERSPCTERRRTIT